MIRSSALGISIVIALLTGLVTAAYILNHHLHRLNSLRIDNSIRLVNNCESGLALLLSPQEIIKDGESRIIDLFEEGEDSVLLKRKNWGGYEIIFSQSFSHGKSISRTAITGTIIKKDSARTALYICDFDRPLSFCGNTKIEGRAFVPAAGIKRAYIEGQNYTGDKFIYGQQLNSKRELPVFNKGLQKSIQEYLSGKFDPEDSVAQFMSLQTDSLTHGFGKRTLVLQGIQHTGGLFLENNIILFTSGKIRIAKNSTLKDVLVFANEIDVEEGFEGNVQLFASERIIIHSTVKLNYPSVAGVIEKRKVQKNEQQPPCIFIGESTEITGAVFALSEEKDAYRTPRVETEKKVTITGDVYVDGELDLKARVTGSVYCQRFMLKTPSSTYENHLLNNEISATGIPGYFSGINLFSNERKKVIVKWLS